MAANPNPARISAAMWEFNEALLALEPGTLYAGSWGNFKPGYHCDRNTLLATAGWQYDYSIQLPPDKLGPGAMGAALDWTFPTAQAGNFTLIRKYTDRVRAAWKARDPRLKGWRELLGNSSDGDTGADGYDFWYWTERTPDDTHKWHIHFSVLRQYIEDRTVYQAMLSILRGETVEQWLSGSSGGDTQVKLFLWNGDYCISRNDGRDGHETVTGQPDPGGLFAKFVLAYPGCAVPGVDTNKWPAPDLNTRGWKQADIDAVFGKRVPLGSTGSSGSGGSGGLTEAQVRGIADEAISQAVITPGT